jgi:hypothetical protein
MPSRHSAGELRIHDVQEMFEARRDYPHQIDLAQNEGKLPITIEDNLDQLYAEALAIASSPCAFGVILHRWQQRPKAPPRQNVWSAIQ